MANNHQVKDPNESDEPQTSFDIELTDEALYAYADIRSQSILGRIDTLIDTLALHPYYGEKYDPAYEASRPPVDCRVLFCAHYGIYYHVNETRRLVTILAIVSQRRDPLTRFTLLDD